jgi:hypothetical protein
MPTVYGNFFDKFLEFIDYSPIIFYVRSWFIYGNILPNISVELYNPIPNHNRVFMHENG